MNNDNNIISARKAVNDLGIKDIDGKSINVTSANQLTNEDLERFATGAAKKDYRRDSYEYKWRSEAEEKEMREERISKAKTTPENEAFKDILEGAFKKYSGSKDDKKSQYRKEENKMGNYLIPANSKKSMLILSVFTYTDLILFGSGIFITGLMLLLIRSNSFFTMVLLIMPALVTGLLVLPIPNYHNVLGFLSSFIKYLTSRRRYYWKGWCVKSVYGRDFEERKQ